MAGRIKHMQRSHKSFAKKNSDFRRFTVKNTNKFEAKKEKKTIVERLAQLFKHQDR